VAGALPLASNFKISFNRIEDGIHLKLYGDFDGSSAHELLNVLKRNSPDTLKINIQTDGLKHIHPFGVDTFIKRFWFINGCADRIVFTGKNAPALALPANHWSL
jgi:hypothetical protein